MRLRYILNAFTQAPFRATFCIRSPARLSWRRWPTSSPRDEPRPRRGANHGGPLADRLRPRQLDQVVGQEHLTGPEGAIGRMVAAGKLSSIILWGPPGTGKTTIARLLADAVGLRFVAISAVFSGVADLKKVFAEAREYARMGRKTLLFVDEIHRFNRAQQDGFLPYVEDGTVTLVGATTENPSFELNAALLSRAQVLILHRLDHKALCKLLDRAEELEERPLPLTPEARDALVASADGDGRFLLNQAETLFSVSFEAPLDPAALGDFLQRRVAVYDKDREGHYNLISALHKSIRGSDPQAALYYLARMLTAGEEPLYVLRRLTRAAVEDIGLADPNALVQCIAAKDTYDFLGSPRASWRSRRPASISPPHPNRTQPMRRRRRRGARRRKPAR
jgi:putative ATPase